MSNFGKPKVFKLDLETRSNLQYINYSFVTKNDKYTIYDENYNIIHENITKLEFKQTMLDLIDKL